MLANLNKSSRLWDIRMVSKLSGTRPVLEQGKYWLGVCELDKGSGWGYGLRIGERVCNMILTCP